MGWAPRLSKLTGAHSLASVKSVRLCTTDVTLIVHLNSNVQNIVKDFPHLLCNFCYKHIQAKKAVQNRYSVGYSSVAIPCGS